MRGYLLLMATWIILAKKIDTENKDFFSSTLMVPELIRTHDQLLNVIRLYASALKNASAVFARYLSEDEVSSVSQPWNNHGDPIKTYKLVKRTSTDINKLVEATRQLRSLDPNLEIENLRESGSLPKDDDFIGISKGLIRLQEVYKLDPLYFATGKIGEGYQTSTKLTASDCLALGQAAEQPNERNTKANLWYRAGLQLSTDNPHEHQTVTDLQLSLARTQQKVQDSPQEDGPQLWKDFIREQEQYTQITEQKSVTNESTSVFPDRISFLLLNKMQAVFRHLCRGERLRPPKLDASCLCHLRQGPHPYLKLRPLKLEILSLDPYLVLLHDIIGEKEINILKEEALPRMVRSSHLSSDSYRTHSDIRVSATSWIEDTKVLSLNQRLEVITGLKAKYKDWEAEEYQVLNYGVGGYYSPHQDYFGEYGYMDPMFNRSGDRIATLMMYLSNVEAGGATAFPFLGLTLYPRKGSAAFWWNLRSNCEGDLLTTHGACPVLYGTKWVSNKWFRVNGQMFFTPCGLQAKTTMRQL